MANTGQYDSQTNIELEDYEREIFVQPEAAVIYGGSVVNSVNGQTGDVTLTTSDLENTSDYQTGAQVQNAIAGKQDEITSSNKLLSGLVDDTNQTNKFVTTSEKQTWNNKYDKPNSGIPESDLADAVKQKLNSSGELSNDIKNAILDCFEHVAWTDPQGQDYYDALENLFFPPKLLVSISALYTQGSATIYPYTPLNDLKSSLVVTAYYSDESTETLSSSDYTLSGTLTVGTSTITVTYGEKTTTFDVTVSDGLVPVSISASFNQGNNTIYEDASLDDLKQYLTVTVNYSDSSSENITNYTLSGTLEITDTSIQSNSTITVSYVGKTTTFTANVTRKFNVIFGTSSWDNSTYFGYTGSNKRATLSPFGFALESGKTYSFSIGSAYPTFQLSYGILNLRENVLELDNKITENVAKRLVEDTSYTSQVSGWVTSANNFTYTADGTYNYIFVQFKRANNANLTTEDINTLKNALTYTVI